MRETFLDILESVNLIDDMKEIKIGAHCLPKLLSVIGEALGKSCDLSILMSESGYIYTKIGKEGMKLLEIGGELGIKVDGEEDLKPYSEEEIKLMEKTRTCPEMGDVEVDLYYCKNLCPKPCCND